VYVELVVIKVALCITLDLKVSDQVFYRELDLSTFTAILLFLSRELQVEELKQDALLGKLN
jgi:hypothetical protein